MEDRSINGGGVQATQETNRGNLGKKSNERASKRKISIIEIPDG